MTRPSALIGMSSLTARMALEDAFRSAGFEPTSCSSAEEARAAVVRKPVAVAVFEPSLPGGVDTVLGAMTAQEPTTPVQVLIDGAPKDLAGALPRTDGTIELRFLGREWEPQDIAREAAARVHTPQDTAHANAPARVLAIDDSATYRAQLEELLTEAGYEVLTASSGDSALALLRTEHVDAILVDLMMPGIDGVETCRRVRADPRFRLTPILMLTAIEGTEPLLAALHEGADDFVNKSGEPEILKARLRAHLRRRQTEADNRQMRERLHRNEVELSRTRSAREVAEARAQSAHILESITDAFFAMDAEGRVTWINRQAEKLLRHSRETLMGRAFHSVFPRSLGTAFAAAFEKARREQVSVDVEDFSPRLGTWLEMHIYPSNGGLSVFFRDVRERRLAELERMRLVDQLEEAVRARDDFVSIASHELKTPLTSMLMHVQSLLAARSQATVSEDRLRPKLEVVQRQVHRLNALIAELLDIARITGRRLELNVDRVDLSELAAEVASGFEHQLASGGTELRMKTEESVVGHWDRGRLEQVLWNLISNAVKYGSGSPVDIEVREDDGGAELVVRDRGIGIAEDAHARIFERFERAVSVRQYGGFGLGLWITRQIIEAHGGEISVQSTPGEGSTFRVRLPLRANDQPTQTEATS